jgi:hypothetical protein
VTDGRLFQPTLTGYRKPAGIARPWRQSAQALVAFVGGALSFAIVGAVNAHRLGLPRSAAYKIVAIALTMEAVMLLLVLGDGPVKGPAVLFAGTAAFWCSQFYVQGTPDRVYHYFTRTDEPYETCDVGVLACIFIRPIEIAALVALAP